MPPISLERNNDLWEVVRKQYDEVGTCKNCVRKDPNVPTTLEVDRIFTQIDMLDRFYVMKPCIDCGKYTEQDTRKEDKPCQYCGGSMGIASTYWASLRTYKEGRKLTAADRKKMGA